MFNQSAFDKCRKKSEQNVTKSPIISVSFSRLFIVLNSHLMKELIMYTVSGMFERKFTIYSEKRIKKMNEAKSNSSSEKIVRKLKFSPDFE